MVICQGVEMLQPNVMCNVNNIIKLNHSDAECNARIKASAIIIMHKSSI
jgi:purine nucleoside permease